MYDSVFTGKENASKNSNCTLSMFLTNFNTYFCLVMHVLLYEWPICLRTAIWFILAFSRQCLPF